MSRNEDQNYLYYINYLLLIVTSRVKHSLKKELLKLRNGKDFLTLGPTPPFLRYWDDLPAHRHIISNLFTISFQETFSKFCAIKKLKFQ